MKTLESPGTQGRNRLSSGFVWIPSYLKLLQKGAFILSLGGVIESSTTATRFTEQNAKPVALTTDLVLQDRASDKHYT